MSNQRGTIITLVLVFGAIFLILLSGLLSFILFQHRQSLQKAAWNDALHIAEAGVNYYRWHLNHTPEDQQPDIQDGNSWCCKVGGVEYTQDSPQCQKDGFTVCGVCDGEPCYEHDYYDPEGKLAGKFILEIKAKKVCDQILGVYVSSCGISQKFPKLKRTVRAKYASTSIGEYAYILNSNVWAGEDREIYGKYHSNGGIKMDGTHNSLVSSATNKWECGLSFDCDQGDCPSGCVPNGAVCECDGVCGAGGPTDLWKFPVPPFDFEGITADLDKIKNLSQTKGKYYPPSTDIDDEGKGYHVIFNSDGTFDIKIITELEEVDCYSAENGWNEVCKEKIIAEKYLPSPYETDDVSLPEGCGLIFVEDNLWVEGTVKGRKTIASADLIGSDDTTTILNWNLDYTTLDGSDSLAVITEKNILIPLNSPNEMILRGVFVAQKGLFGRRHYQTGTYKRDLLTIYGTIVSNGRVGTKWTYYHGGWASGYNERENYFDEKLARDPPPLLPYVSKELELISWEEI